jgi:hypothetical protein
MEAMNDQRFWNLNDGSITIQITGSQKIIKGSQRLCVSGVMTQS